MHIIGTAGEVKERVAQWEETGVTTLMLSLGSPDEVRAVAELLT
jgi:alkanesulfonate monooxygenase SsuD/methylene tetrahydromethanopterin reductase-like flavin-dependent oxidoreductase (luciferase family)